MASPMASAAAAEHDEQRDGLLSGNLEPGVGALQPEEEEPEVDARAVAEAEANKRAIRQLSWAVGLAFFFMAAEVVGGVWSKSLAVITDAAHMLSDVAGLVISIAALLYARKSPTKHMTFGYGRVEVFGAVVSVAIIWAITIVLLIEAVHRIVKPEVVDGEIMFITASLGLVVNIGMMKVLHQGGHGHSHSHGGGGHGHSHDNLNVRAAWIHALGDLIQSIGVMIAAGLIWYDEPRFWWADPACTFVFGFLVLWTTTGILKDTMAVLLESTPANVDAGELLGELERIQGVSNAHMLRLWCVAPGDLHMTVHLVADDPTQALAAAQLVAAQHGVKRSTIQVERCGSTDAHHCSVHNGGCRGMELCQRDSRRAAQGDFPARVVQAAPGTFTMGSALRVTSPAVHAGGCGRRIVMRCDAECTGAACAAGCGRQRHDEHGHSHSHGGGHSHSHGGGHSHSHGGGHSHSHGGGESGGHSHSHGGGESGGHSHSHGGGGACGHSHAG